MYNFCDINKDVNDENHLQPAPSREDGQESALLKISNHSFMFESINSNEDSGTEEEQDNFLIELERFKRGFNGIQTSKVLGGRIDLP